MNHQTLAFPSMGTKSLGLYPIVNDVSQLKRLLPLGINIIQLRIKEAPSTVVEKQIQQSIQIANDYNTKLFINDYWELAAHYGAYGIHLGQSDLKDVAIHLLRKQGLRLGISAYSRAELDYALSLNPSYIAFGPIFPTQSKLISVQPQGIATLKHCRSIVTCPLVAIGGIGVKQLPEVLATNVDGIAVISAISQARNPIQATIQLMNIINNYTASKDKINLAL